MPKYQMCLLLPLQSASRCFLPQLFSVPQPWLVWCSASRLALGLSAIYYLHLFVSCIMGTQFSRKVATETTSAHTRRHDNARRRLRPTLRRRHVVRHFTAQARGSVAARAMTSRPPSCWCGWEPTFCRACHFTHSFSLSCARLAAGSWWR